MKVLHLTLSKKPFEVMVTGEKDIEYRSPSAWIKKRLMDKYFSPKHYDLVKFVNGYGSDKPYFIAEYKGYEFAERGEDHEYSNGLWVDVYSNDIKIFLGKVVEVGNYVIH